MSWLVSWPTAATAFRPPDRRLIIRRFRPIEDTVVAEVVPGCHPCGSRRRV
ncbi:MAG: hypothetical protein R2705_04130 [Ilumatobacteraceae bacterium]